MNALYSDLANWQEAEQLTFTFVTDGIESAVRQAQAVAGDKEVNVIGTASITRQCLYSWVAARGLLMT